MTIRSRLLLFSLLLVLGAMLAAGIMGYQMGTSSLESNFAERLTQIRTIKAQALQSDLENLGNSLLTVAEMSRMREALRSLFTSEEQLYKWAQSHEASNWQQQLEDFYAHETNPELKKSLGHLPKLPLFLQSQFIREAKKHDIPKKNVVTIRDFDELKFFKMHEDIHPFFLDYAERFQLSDIMLVDRDGTIIYTLQKGLNFGTNLNSGIFSNSRLSDVYRWSLTASPRNFKFFDFAPMAQFWPVPVAYYATPIFDKSLYLGTVIFQLPLGRFDQILSDNHQWKKSGLKETGEIVAYGADGLLRNNSRLYFENPIAFEKAYKGAGNHHDLFENIHQAGTTAMQVGLGAETIRRYIHSEEFTETSADYMGTQTLKSVGRVRLPGGAEWVLVAKIDTKETSAPVTYYIWLFILGTATILSAVLLSTFFFSKRLVRPLEYLLSGLKKVTEQGAPTPINYDRQDEYEPLFKNYNTLAENLDKTRKEKEVLVDIFDSLNELLFVVEVKLSTDINHRKMIVVNANHKAAELIGISQQSLKNSDLQMWIEGELTEMMDPLVLTMPDYDEKPKEGFLKRITGERIPLNLSWARLKSSSAETLQLVFIGTDIRWKKESERALQVREGLLKASQSLSKTGSFRWEMDTGHLIWSEEQFNILGLDPLKTEPSFDLFRQLVFPEDLPLLDRALKDSQKSLTPFSVDLRIRRADTNEYIWTRMTGQTEYDAYGNPVSTWGINQDITDLKKAEHDLISTKNEALKSSQAKSQFLAHMSHEIRTPMNAIMGMAELLKETPLNKDQQYYLTIFRKAGEVLMALINDILDLSKIEAGEVSIENIAFDMNKMMMDVQEMMRPRALEKGVEYSYEISPGVNVEMMGDPTKLRQVLINLVSNSIKFTERGQIKVSIGKNPTKKDTLLISVSDSGVGIPPTKQHLIFQKFSQADSSITRRYGGTGLGLAISKSLVELMGGQIWFKSRENVGTTFFFTVPYREQSYGASLVKPLTFQAPKLDFTPTTTSAPAAELPAEKPAVEAATPHDPNKKVRILLADDTEDNRILFVHYLKNGPYEIIQAENGLEAVDKIKSQEFDIVFMDVQMPEMDGYAATSIIREWEHETHHSHIPIIALTAHALSDDRQKSLNAGCDDHVTKPFRKDALVGTINRFTH